MLDLAGNGAQFSGCGKYRYQLHRHVGAGHEIYGFFGVNPSTADASVDDATVRKWRGFCARYGASRFVVGNVFSYRATDVKELGRVDDCLGPDHFRFQDHIIEMADVLVPCWGSRAKVPQYLWPFMDELMGRLYGSGKPVMCWGKTASGDPKHPLMLSYDTPFVPA